MDTPHLGIHSSVGGHVGYFHFGAILNIATGNTGVHVLHEHLFSVLLGGPRNGIDGSYDNSMLNFSRNCQTIFLGALF